eukprot:TRINITY_DN6449_c0_g1_i1.p1 TRINITY_DN6449_c0_g1~~TRINITY_DN6449_c0_g1_i1.p1  ORF type:complete len:208 (+),score=32.53 TRINITY_DN6449_c0_g1_i1:179-802(+)
MQPMLSRSAFLFLVVTQRIAAISVRSSSGLAVTVRGGRALVLSDMSRSVDGRGAFNQQPTLPGTNPGNADVFFPNVTQILPVPQWNASSSEVHPLPRNSSHIEGNRSNMGRMIDELADLKLKAGFVFTPPQEDVEVPSGVGEYHTPYLPSEIVEKIIDVECLEHRLEDPNYVCEQGDELLPAKWAPAAAPAPAGAYAAAPAPATALG